MRKNASHSSAKLIKWNMYNWASLKHQHFSPKHPQRHSIAHYKDKVWRVLWEFIAWPMSCTCQCQTIYSETYYNSLNDKDVDCRFRLVWLLGLVWYGLVWFGLVWLPLQITMQVPCMFIFDSHYYNVIIMSAMASQITSLTFVYSTIYSGADQRKHQSSTSLAFVRGIHRGPVNSPHKGPVTRKMFPFDDVIMHAFGVVSPKLGHRYDHLSTTDVTLKDMGKTDWNTQQHNDEIWW